MRIEDFKRVSNDIVRATGDVFVGDEVLLRKTLSAALSNGHVLFEDNPGLGKTLLAKVFAKVTGCGWGRVQFTPDIMPADIVGTRIWKPQLTEFRLERGPVFTNILLADEINRAPPKTQSALLEAMEERQVTIEGETHQLEAPFFVIATQNPIEQEGTFPLPEAQMDRFMLKMSTGYVKDRAMESEILRRRVLWRTDTPIDRVEPAVDQATFLEMQEMVESDIYIDGQILDYVSDLVRGTRTHQAVEVGSSPRGGLSLVKVSRAHAAIMGRDFVTPDDVKTFLYEALAHRIILKMEYELDGTMDAEGVVAAVAAEVEVPTNFMRR